MSLGTSFPMHRGSTLLDGESTQTDYLSYGMFSIIVLAFFYPLLCDGPVTKVHSVLFEAITECC